MPSPRTSGSAAAAPHAVYLDHAATTQMLPCAIEAMTAVLGDVGNASSLHGSGRTARRKVEESRESIAADLGARPSEVIFTSGGTESDNLAVKGIYWAQRDANPRRTRILASAVEHHAVLDAVEWLVEHEGAQVTWLPVAADGMLDPEVLRAELSVHADETALVTVMWANNEVGTLMPIRALADIANEFSVPLHSDAVQAVPHLPVDFGASGLAASSIAAHKFGGPHGVGALLLGRHVACVPLVHGGGGERDLRAGTPDTAAIVGMAAALRHTTQHMQRRSRELQRLWASLVDGVRAGVPEAVLNGPVVNGPAVDMPAGSERLSSIAHFTFPGCEGDSLLMLLDAAGIECSTGSACTAGVASASHVLIAMGSDPALARGSLRFSLGASSTAQDVEALLAVLPQVVDRAEAAGMASVGVREGNR